MKLVIPRVTPSGNEMRRKYRNRFAYARLRGVWEVELLVALAGRVIALRYAVPELRLQVTFTRFRLRVTFTRYGKKLLDRDNLYAGVKAPLDAMARLGIIRSDSERDIELVVKQEQAKETRTEIEIEAIG